MEALLSYMEWSCDKFWYLWYMYYLGFEIICSLLSFCGVLLSLGNNWFISSYEDQFYQFEDVT